MNPLEIFGGMGEPSKYYQQAMDLQKGGSKFFMPEYAAGTAELPQYMHTLNQLTRHPTQLENQIMGSYTESPTAQYQTQLLTNQMANQAAAGGQLGTPNEQQALATQTQGIVSKDQQRYYQDAMDPYHMGLSGEQSLVGMGSQGATSLARQKNLQATQEDMQAALAAKEEAAKASGLGAMVGAVAGIAGDVI